MDFAYTNQTSWDWNPIYPTASGINTPMQIYPAMVAIPSSLEPEPKSNNPLDWLKEQISEICELASVI